MSVQAKGKWIVVTPNDMAVTEVAEQSLRLRFDVVARRLPLAAHAADKNIEHVHQLRVACRRASATVDAYRNILPSGKKSVRKWLKRIRRSAGPARDLDVMITRMGNGYGEQAESTSEASSASRHHLEPEEGRCRLLRRLRELRTGAQQLLVDVARSAKKGSMQDDFDRLLSGCRKRKHTCSNAPFDEFAAEQIEKQINVFLEECKATDQHIEQLHRIRIAGKQLRYSLELFQSALPVAWRKSIYEEIADLQERLGQVNDHASAQLMFQRLLANLPADSLAAYVADLVIAEHAAWTRAREEFLTLWNSELRERIRTGLSALAR